MSIFKQPANKGSSPILLILAILGLVFVAQMLGFSVYAYWPIIIIVIIAVIIWAK